jgi:hypothetical protein
MTDAALSDLASAEAHFDRFARAFGTFDTAEAADLFAAPGVALGGRRLARRADHAGRRRAPPPSRIERVPP